MPRQKYHTISTGAAKELIWSQRINGAGGIFAVAFLRATSSRDKQRKEGTQEVLYVRFNVRAHLAAGPTGWVTPDGARTRYWREGAKPAGAAYDRARRGCFCAYCMGGKDRSRRGGMRGYKSIRFDSLRWLKIDGIVYKVGAPPPPQH